MRSVAFAGLVFVTAVSFLAAAACDARQSDDDPSPNSVRFLVVRGGSQPGQVLVEEGPHRLAVHVARTRAEERTGFHFLLPSSLPSSLKLVEIRVTENAAAPFPAAQRFVTATFVKNAVLGEGGSVDSADAILLLGMTNPVASFPQQDGERVLLPKVGTVVVTSDQVSGDSSYLWIVDDVAYRLAYERGQGAFSRDEILEMIESIIVP